MQWRDNLMNDQEKPWNLKHQQVDLVGVLQRPVETTIDGGLYRINNTHPQVGVGLLKPASLMLVFLKY